SGSESDFLLSPKFSAIWAATDDTEISLNLGYGFHSNDARGTVILVDPTNGEAATRVEPLVRARGADVGVRTHLGDWHSTFTVFYLELDSELVFVGDGGATEANRPSRRRGLEWANYYRFSERMSFDLDVTLTDAEFTDPAPEGNEIPGAIGTTIAAGLSVEDLFTSSAGALRGALRWRYFGDVPLIEDGSEEWGSSSVLNARLGFRFSNGLDLVLDVFNALDSEDSDIEYFYASRLPGEAAGGVEDVHFHPMESRSARLTVGWRY
ncbi:MAG: TonB-dependent receptor, partial [Acidobacteriota bacterium]